MGLQGGGMSDADESCELRLLHELPAGPTVAEDYTCFKVKVLVSKICL